MEGDGAALGALIAAADEQGSGSDVEVEEGAAGAAGLLGAGAAMTATTLTGEKRTAGQLALAPPAGSAKKPKQHADATTKISVVQGWGAAFTSLIFGMGPPLKSSSAETVENMRARVAAEKAKAAELLRDGAVVCDVLRERCCARGPLRILAARGGRVPGARTRHALLAHVPPRLVRLGARLLVRDGAGC